MTEPQGTFVTVGQVWDQQAVPLPAGDPSFGWHAGHLLLISDPVGLCDVDRYTRSPVRLGFAQHGPLAIVMMKASGLPADVFESARPYLLGDEPPEVTVEPSTHILWTVVLVVRGVVVNIRAFTTSPQVTVYLRRVFAEQRAAGPISQQEASEHILAWQDLTPDPRSLWRRAVVTCLGGD